MTKLIALLFFTFALLAQQAGSISGTVLDHSGGVVPAASVTLKSPGENGITVTSDNSGYFHLQPRAPGQYELIVTSPGFTTKSVKVDFSGANVTTDVRLQPSQLNQSVTVSESVSTIAPESESTATRLNVELMNLPQSVSIITNQVMLEQGVSRPFEALRNVAGLNLAGSYNGTYEYMSLRGFTQSQLSSYFRDGIRFVMLAAPNVAASEQIEVLKGPAAILYGTVTPGGIINIVSKKPQEKYHNQLTYRGGSFRSHEGFLDSTGPLWSSKNLFYRLNTYGRNADSYRDLVYNNGYLLNPSLSWRPTLTTTVRADIEYDRLFTLIDPGFPAPDGISVASASIIPRDRFLGFKNGDFRSLRRFYNIDISQNLAKDWILRGTYNYNNFMRDNHMAYNTGFNPSTGDVTLTYWGQNLFYYTYYGRADVSGVVRFGRVTNSVVAGGDTMVLRSHGSSPLPIVVPTVNLYHPDYNRWIPFPYGTPMGSVNKQKQLGGYFQDMVTLPWGISVFAGARWTSLEATGQQTTKRLNPSAGIVYRPKQWISLYGSYAESFEPITGLDVNQRPFLPSLGKQVEVGMKNRFFSDRLSTTFAWFDLRRTNVLTPDPFNPGFSVQSGKQGGKGVEVEARGRINSNWQLIATYTHLTMRVLQDNRYPVGNFLPQAPRNSASLWAMHDFSGRFSPLTAGFGVFYTGRMWDSVLNRFQAPAFTTVDANLGWRFEKHYRLQVIAKNLFNQKYYASASNILSLYPAAPRSFQASFTVTF